MIKKISKLIICLVLSSIPLSSLKAQELSFFYPEEIKNLKSEILTPNQFFGTPMGEHHLQYESVVAYMQYLNSVSPRMLIQFMGKTHQQRPIISVVISSEERLAPYKKSAPNSVMQLSKELYPGRDQFDEDLLINWLGYSVHGNEASGVNSSVITAYLLVASNDSYVENILNNSITVMIPAINPDGVTKYATWVNGNLARAGNNDLNNREFNPPAPSSRSNHYWFDLNRDWLVATQPEGKAVQKLYHNWRPNIVNDYHEQGGTGGTYFAPGVRSKTNPFIPDENWLLTAEVSKWHAKYLDRVGQKWFSQRGYDSFFTGKGAAYPSLFGSLGILYEQINPKGLNRLVKGKEYSLAVATRNQVLLSFSSLNAAQELKGELLDYRKNYRNLVIKQNGIDLAKGYLFKAGSDPSMAAEFMKILEGNKVDYYRNPKDKKGEESYLVPFSQPHLSAALSIFETQTKYIDTTFYDLSTWTVPLAYNIEYSKVVMPSLDGLEPAKVKFIKRSAPAKSEFGYIIPIDDLYSYNLLYYLTSKGVSVKASKKALSLKTAEEQLNLGLGTVLVDCKEQTLKSEAIYELIEEYYQQLSDCNDKVRGFIAKANIQIYPLDEKGYKVVNKAKKEFTTVTTPKIAILIGSGGQYSVSGELWHLLDFKYRVPVTLIDINKIDENTLSPFNVIVATGNLALNSQTTSYLTTWAKKNTLIAIRGGYRLAQKLKHPSISLKKVKLPNQTRRYKPMPGVIVESKIDLKHPLSVGLTKPTLPLFINNDIILQESVATKFTTFANISSKPILSGFVPSSIVELLKDTPYIVSQPRYIYFPFNPNFRAHWAASSRVFMNAIFYRELL